MIIKIIVLSLCAFVVLFSTLAFGLYMTVDDKVEVYPICTLKPLWKVRDYNVVWGKFGAYEQQYFTMSYTDEYTWCINKEK